MRDYRVRDSLERGRLDDRSIVFGYEPHQLESFFLGHRYGDRGIVVLCLLPT